MVVKDYWSYQIAEFHQDICDEIETELDSLRHLRTAVATMLTFERASSELCIEDFIDTRLDRVSSLPETFRNAVPASLSYFQDRNAEAQVMIDELCSCIDVLFFFERETMSNEVGVLGRPKRLQKSGQNTVECNACHKVLPAPTGTLCVICPRCDATTVLHPSAVPLDSPEWAVSVETLRTLLKRWIYRTCGTLIGVASFKEVAYIVQNIMRLPGVAEDRSWVLDFIRFPTQTILPNGEIVSCWTEALVDHFLAILSIVLRVDTAYDGSTRNMTIEEWIVVQNPIKASTLYLTDEDYMAVFNRLPFTFACHQILATTVDDVRRGYSKLKGLVEALGQALVVFRDYPSFTELLACKITLVCNICSASPYFNDQIMKSAVIGLLNTTELHQLPFETLSKDGCWDIFELIYFEGHVPTRKLTDFRNCRTRESWLRCCSGFRVSFKRKSDIIRALASLASKRPLEEVTYIILDEISSDPDAIAAVCASHPTTISQILHHASLELIQNLSLKEWIPTNEDLGIIQGWLKNGSDEERGRWVLEHLNSYLPPTVVRNVAIVLLEAYTSRPDGWFGDSLKTWCWDRLLMLPFDRVERLLFSSDLSREAAILRRSYYGVNTVKSWDLINVATESEELVTSEDPFICYLICQVTDHLLTTGMNKWRPLVVLIQREEYIAACKVLRVVSSTFANDLSLLTSWTKDDLNLEAEPIDILNFARRLERYGYIDAEMKRNIEQELAHAVFSTKLTQRVVAGLHKLVTDRYVHPIVLQAIVAEPGLFSRSNTMAECFRSVLEETTIAEFWLQVLCSVANWWENPQTRSYVDLLVRRSRESCLTLLQDEYQRLIEADVSIYPSFLPVTVRYTIFSQPNEDYTQFIPNCAAFSFYSLWIESQREWPLYQAMGETFLSQAKLKKMKKSPRNFGHSDCTTLSQYRILRWVVYLIELDPNEPFLILYWQLFFILYFATFESRHFGQFFINDTDRKSLKAKLRNIEEQHSIYTAMLCWLEHPDPNQWVRQNLPQYYSTDRLQSVMTATPDSVELWWDLLLSPASSPSPLAPPMELIHPSTGNPSQLIFASSLVIPPRLATRVTANGFDDQILIENARNYSEHLSELVALDRDLLDNLMVLYQPRERKHHSTKVCSERSACRRPAIFNFTFEEWDFNHDTSGVLSSIEKQQLGNTTGQEPMDMEVCGQLIFLKQLIHSIQDPIVGLEWFNRLLHFDTAVTRLYPPIRQVVWPCIRHLGDAFQTDADQLLSLLLTDPKRISLLASCFDPNLLPHQCLDYFSKLMATPNMEPYDRLTLLQRFDFKRWLQVANFYQRSSVICLLLEDLPICTDMALQDCYCAILLELCNPTHFSEHVEQIMTFLVQHISWFRIPFPWKSAKEKERAICLLSDYIFAKRWEDRSILSKWMAEGSLVSILNVMNQLITRWKDIEKAYSCVLLNLYQPASMVSNSVTIEAWDESETMATGICIINCFLRAIEWWNLDELSCVWSFYSNHLTTETPEYSLNVIETHLIRLPWEKWTTFEVNQLMKHCRVRFFIRDLVCKLTFTTDFGSVLALLLIILNTQPITTSFAHYLSQDASILPWNVTTAEIQDACDQIGPIPAEIEWTSRVLLYCINLENLSTLIDLFLIKQLDIPKLLLRCHQLIHQSNLSFDQMVELTQLILLKLPDQSIDFVVLPGIQLACLSASTRSLSSVKQLARVTEAAMTSFIQSSVGNWQSIASVMQIPEISHDDFITSCIDQVSLFTLFTLCLQQPQEYMTSMINWIREMKFQEPLEEMKCLYILSELLDAIVSQQTLRSIRKLCIELKTRRQTRLISQMISNCFQTKTSVSKFEIALEGIEIFLRLLVPKHQMIRMERDTRPYDPRVSKVAKGLKTLEPSGLTAFLTNSDKMFWKNRQEFWTLLFLNLYPDTPWLLRQSGLLQL